MPKRKKKELNPTIPAIIISAFFMAGVFAVTSQPIKQEQIGRENTRAASEAVKPVDTMPVVLTRHEGDKHAIIKFVMNDIEGGSKYVKDAGGYAKYGINSKYHPGIDVKNLTEKKALAVYKSKYWDERLDSLKPAFQIVAFDALVNHGNDSGTWVMIDAAKGSPKKLISMRKRYYARLIEVYPAKAKNKAGWDNRLVKLQQYASK